MGPKIHEIMRRIMFRVVMVIDIALLLVSFALAAAVITGSEEWIRWSGLFAMKVSLPTWVMFTVGAITAHRVLVFCKLYQSKRMSRRSAESLEVVRAMMLLSLCLWCEGKIFLVPGPLNRFLLAFLAIGTLLLVLTRLLLRSVLGAIRKRGRNLHHVLILGTNERALSVARAMQAAPELGCNLLGFVDDEWSGMENFRASGFQLVCGYDELPEFLRKNVVDEICLYLPLRSFYGHCAEFAKLAKQHGILVRLDPDVLDMKFEWEDIDGEGGVPQLAVRGGRVESWQVLMKRLLDITVSLVLLLLLSPLFLVAAALIKLTSPGSVLFSQKRMGLNKRQFTMYKFRTMVPAAESVQDQLEHLNEMTGPVFKIKDDPRITPIGRVLRKTSIDELPQLLNVLSGDMSLVGPRAIPVRDYESFSEDWHRRRFSVLPGITCLWQVRGRNSIPFDEWMVLDMQYIDRWSLWLDLKILAQTIPAVIRGSGAA
jgi:exopolysaccharide biosynthesis polyprenyl glycosylphosphotransferase